MTDPKIPQPALYSETLEKARRNTLVWSALAIAAELAQTKEHTLKSSILGTDAGLPVAMVAFLFIALSAFHFVAFWFEKKRIERWRSEYVAKHQGPDLKDRISALFERIDNQFIEVDSSYRQTIPHLDLLTSHFNKVEKSYNELHKMSGELRDRLSYIQGNLRNGSVYHDKLISLVEYSERNPLVPANYNIEFSNFIRELNDMRNKLSISPGPSEDHRRLLQDITSQLNKLSTDISTSERIYFSWYEVYMPVAAILGAFTLWAGATAYPDLPLVIRGVFVRN